MSEACLTFCTSSSRFHEVGTLTSMSPKDSPEKRQLAGGATSSKGSKISPLLAILPTQSHYPAAVVSRRNLNIHDKMLFEEQRKSHFGFVNGKNKKYQIWNFER